MCQRKLAVRGRFVGDVTEYETAAGDFRIATFDERFVVCRYDRGRVWPSRMEHFDTRAKAVNWIARYL